MKGAIKTEEIGKVTIYKKDKSGKNTTKIEETIPGKLFDISKGGATIALEAQSAVEEFEAGGVAECVLAASCGCDPKILWLGAVVYGYMIDTCTLKDIE